MPMPLLQGGMGWVFFQPFELRRILCFKMQRNYVSSKDKKQPRDPEPVPWKNSCELQSESDLPPLLQWMSWRKMTWMQGHEFSKGLPCSVTENEIPATYDGLGKPCGPIQMVEHTTYRLCTQAELVDLANHFCQ